MQISITGPRGGGATTLAAVVAAHLKALGQRVSVRASCEVEAAFVRNSHAKERVLSNRAHITIIVGHETEDEQGVGSRLPAKNTGDKT